MRKYTGCGPDHVLGQCWLKGLLFGLLRPNTLMESLGARQIDRKDLSGVAANSLWEFLCLFFQAQDVLLPLAMSLHRAVSGHRVRWQ